jgi:hypothetical protein
MNYESRAERLSFCEDMGVPLASADFPEMRVAVEKWRYWKKMERRADIATRMAVVAVISGAFLLILSMLWRVSV